MALNEPTGDPIASRGRRPPGATDPIDSSDPPALAPPPDDCPATYSEEDAPPQGRSRLRPSHNGGVAMQNGSLRNLPTSSLCCQHCHFHPDLICPCGQPECPLQQNHGSGSRPGPLPSSSSCPCYLSYSNHQAHSVSPFCLHQHHQQHWQEHLQNQTAGIRYVTTCSGCTSCMF